MFGVLMVTILLTIILVGSNMDIILKQGVTFQVRSEITEDPSISQSFSDPAEFEAFIQDQIEKPFAILTLFGKLEIENKYV